MAVLRRPGRFAQKRETEGKTNRPTALFSIGLLLRWLCSARGEAFEHLISGVWEIGRRAA
jgi:hypothetical protein